MKKKRTINQKIRNNHLKTLKNAKHSQLFLEPRPKFYTTKILKPQKIPPSINKIKKKKKTKKNEKKKNNKPKNSKQSSENPEKCKTFSTFPGAKAKILHNQNIKTTKNSPINEQNE